MAKKSKKPSAKVNDIAKPGETAASANARPTITGHKPAIKNDPMVAFSPPDEDGGEDTEEKVDKKAYLNKSRSRIDPISKNLKTGKDQPDSQESSTEKEEQAEDKNTDNDKESANVTSESAAIEAIAQTADSKKLDSKLNEEEQKRKEHIEEIAKSGAYRLPILEGGHKGSAERLVSWLFLLLLLASVGVYLAVDAGYIDIGFNLPFEFIEN